MNVKQDIKFQKQNGSGSRLAVSFLGGKCFFVEFVSPRNPSSQSGVEACHGASSEVNSELFLFLSNTLDHGSKPESQHTHMYLLCYETECIITMCNTDGYFLYQFLYRLRYRMLVMTPSMDFKPYKWFATHRVKKSCFQGSRESPEVNVWESSPSSRCGAADCWGHSDRWLSICTKLAVTMWPPGEASCSWRALGLGPRGTFVSQNSLVWALKSGCK